MARIEEIERRLLNWARWLVLMRSGGGNFARSTYEERVDNDRDGWDAPAAIPTDEGEALETDRAVASLEATLQKAVIDHYTGSGDVAQKCRRAGIATATLYARVDQAHRAIARWLLDVEHARKAERDRVQALQRVAARG